MYAHSKKKYAVLAGARSSVLPIAVLVIAAAWLLAPSGLAVSETVYRVQTDNGELTITVDNPEVEVVIKQNGKLVRIIDTKLNKELVLRDGLYDQESNARPGDLQMSLDRVSISRGQSLLATIERRKRQAAAAMPAEIIRDVFNGDDDVPAHVYRVSFSAAGRFFLAGGDAGSRSPVRIYDTKTGKLVTQLTPDEEVGWSGARFSPDETKIVSWGSGTANLYVWDTATGRQLHKLRGHKDCVLTASFSHDGKRIVSSSTDRTSRVWNVATGKELLVLQGHTSDCAACFAPNDNHIVSWSTDNTVRGWDAVTGNEIWKQAEQSESAFVNVVVVHDMCFSRDGRVLSLQRDGSVQILDVATGKIMANVASPGEAHGAAFVQGGELLAWWAKDNAVRVWDMANRKVVRTLDLGNDLQSEPDNVTVSSDGRMLLTAHTNQTVRVHDLSTGKELHRFQSAPQTGMRSLAISPDARFATAGSFRGWVYLWRLPTIP
jgi:WD40 repeat protein